MVVDNGERREADGRADRSGDRLSVRPRQLRARPADRRWARKHPSDPGETSLPYAMPRRRARLHMRRLGLRRASPQRAPASKVPLSSRGLPGIAFDLGTRSGLVPIHRSARRAFWCPPPNSASAFRAKQEARPAGPKSDSQREAPGPEDPDRGHAAAEEQPATRGRTGAVGVTIARKERAELADTSHVDEHKKVEEWADALLEQHRTAPRKSAAPTGDSHSAMDGLLVQLATKLSGQPPDPEIWERLRRLRRQREHFAFLARLEPVVTLIGVLVCCALVYAVYNP
jgi:hypothetical protein